MYEMSNSTGDRQRGNAAGSFTEKRPHGREMFSIQNMTPQQLEMLEQLIGMLGPDSFISRLANGDQSAFQEMEAPAHRQFQETTGGLATRFSGAGMGARRGSGFQNAMSQSAEDFAMKLQGNRTNLRNQALRDLMGMSHNLLQQRPFDRGYVKKDRSGENDAEAWAKLLGFVPGVISASQGGGSYIDALKGALSIFGGGGGGSNASSYDTAFRMTGI
jgi:hypothetical protein